MKGRAVAMSVDEQIEVRDDHSAAGRAKASDSNWSLSWFSFIGSIPGASPLWWGETRYFDGLSLMTLGGQPAPEGFIDHLLEGALHEPGPLPQG